MNELIKLVLAVLQQWLRRYTNSVLAANEFVRNSVFDNLPRRANIYECKCTQDFISFSSNTSCAEFSDRCCKTFPLKNMIIASSAPENCPFSTITCDRQKFENNIDQNRVRAE
jgi:trehalose-6-phosphate synthase